MVCSLAEGGALTRVAVDGAEERLDVKLTLRKLPKEVAHLSGPHNTRQVRQSGDLGYLKMRTASAEKTHAAREDGASKNGVLQVAHR